MNENKVKSDLIITNKIQIDVISEYTFPENRISELISKRRITLISNKLDLKLTILHEKFNKFNNQFKFNN